jgi:hypothetical protein
MYSLPPMSEPRGRPPWRGLGLFGVAISILGCALFGRPGDKVSAPPIPTPLSGINSQWDDFNAAHPRNWQGIVYSTNRGTEGKNFDVWWAKIAWSEKPHAVFLPEPFTPSLMSGADERGPLLIDAKVWGTGTEYDWPEVLVLASNRPGGRGGLDLYWASGCHKSSYPCDGPIHPLEGLNSPANDAYLSLPFADRRALFASDRSGSGYDIYEASWPSRGSLSEVRATISLVRELSSDADDNAPYVFETKDSVGVVFVSKRSGGLGEHDIWCSRLEGRKWSSPVNLGAKINSPADEFRPSVFEVSGSDFLLYSSNRPGGAGGYDLYSVRYPGCLATQ